MSLEDAAATHRLTITEGEADGRPQYLGTCSCGEDLGSYLNPRSVEQIYRSVHLGNVVLRAAQRSTR